MERISVGAGELWLIVESWLSSPQFYLQLAAVGIAISIAFLLSTLIKSRVEIFREEPAGAPSLGVLRILYRARTLLFPLILLILLDVSADVLRDSVEQSWVIRVAQSLVVVFLIYTVITRFIRDPLIKGLLKWIGIPLATLQVFGWLDDVIRYLDSLSLDLGSVSISVYAIGRTIFFGLILFWLGRISNATAKRAIRNHPRLDVGAREVAAKLFEIALFVVIGLLLLQIMGVGLTALTVFGGAFGIGLGLGLQRIAANFISGIIILLDRSITLNDYIELEDGRAGRLRELNMRSATLETFDGRDIVVPNETFVSTAFTNWTHNHRRQRYDLRFMVAYKTDIPPMLEVVKNVVRSHPQVLSGAHLPLAEQPDAEIDDFGDSGIVILVEFWMEGLDDGDNRVAADLRLMIWSALREHGFEMPFPQREVTIVNPQDARLRGRSSR